MKLLFLMALCTLISCEQSLFEEEQNNLNYPDNRITRIDNIQLKEGEIVLTHRLLNSCKNYSCNFDLYNMVQNYGYGLTIEFGNDWGENEIDTELAGGEHGELISLGKSSCKALSSESNPYDRETEPHQWILETKFWQDLNYNGTSYLALNEGHCYLLQKRDDQNKIIVMFHVKKLKANDYVIIDEIEHFLKEGGPY